MRRVAIVCAGLAWSVVAVVGAQQAPPRDQQATFRPPVGTAVLGGVVTADEPGGRPLRLANVGILGTDNGVIRLTTTDDAGRFIAGALPAGRYLVSASKPPYVDMIYGAKDPGRPGTAIVMQDGERRIDLAIKLMRGGVITGTIIDESGQPAVGVSVELLEPPTQPGMDSTLQQMRGLLAMSRPVTDDRGVYRISGLAPGNYTVGVTPRDVGGGDAVRLAAGDVDAAVQAVRDAQQTPVVQSGTTLAPASTVITPQSAGGVGAMNSNIMMMNPGNRPMFAPPDAQTMGYAPVYYPGTTDLSEATFITIAAGDVRTGIDVVARLVLTTRVEGVVLGPDSQPVRNVTVRARITGRTETLSSLFAGGGGMGRFMPDGRFVITGLAPGRYTIEARTNSAPFPMPGMPQPTGSSTPQLLALEDITASGQPITGMVLRLQGGLSLSGRVRFDATTLEPPKDLTTVRIVVRSSQMDVLALATGGTTPVAADGTFTVTGLAPGQYFVAATAAVTAESPVESLAWLGQTVTVGGRDVSDLPIDVKSDVTEVVVTMTDRQQALSGTLQDSSGRPAPDFTVVLFAADRKYWVPMSRRILITRPATDGRFAWEGPLGPPPGDYLLAAVTDLKPDQQYDRTFLDAISKAAIPITIAPGQKKIQDLRIVGGTRPY